MTFNKRLFFNEAKWLSLCTVVLLQHSAYSVFSTNLRVIIPRSTDMVAMKCSFPLMAVSVFSGD